VGASILLGAMAFILLFVLYDLFIGLWPAGYYLLTATSIDYMALFVAYCFVVARRYNRSQRMEVMLLKNQIRPHFIHNSLACIINLSRTDADNARKLLTEFSSYLRGYYDYDTEERIALGQELELVRAYAALEQARFGERVRVEYDIESERLLLPPLSLQPLVENAFIHGLREKPGGGTVTIYAKRTDKGKALVGVRDDGLGLRAKAPATRDGVGIENINRRLSRLYRTQLVFAQPAGGGCDVSMEIPWKEADKNARIHR
jgi:LytS/YehU family sensor histidine kinase